MTGGATITPADNAHRCEEPGCDCVELLSRVEPDAARARILCPTHRVEYLREVYDK